MYPSSILPGYTAARIYSQYAVNIYFMFHVKQLEGTDIMKKRTDSYFRLKYSGNKPYINETNYVIKNVDIAKRQNLFQNLSANAIRFCIPTRRKLYLGLRILCLVVTFGYG